MTAEEDRIVAASKHYVGKPIGHLHPDDLERLHDIVQDHGDWAASALQSAKYAAEDAVRAITTGNFMLARQR